MFLYLHIIIISIQKFILMISNKQKIYFNDKTNKIFLADSNLRKSIFRDIISFSFDQVNREFANI